MRSETGLGCRVVFCFYLPIGEMSSGDFGFVFSTTTRMTVFYYSLLSPRSLDSQTDPVDDDDDDVSCLVFLKISTS